MDTMEERAWFERKRKWVTL